MNYTAPEDRGCCDSIRKHLMQDFKFDMPYSWTFEQLRAMCAALNLTQECIKTDWRGAKAICAAGNCTMVVVADDYSEYNFPHGRTSDEAYKAFATRGDLYVRVLPKGTKYYMDYDYDNMRELLELDADINWGTA